MHYAWVSSHRLKTKLGTIWVEFIQTGKTSTNIELNTSIFMHQMQTSDTEIYQARGVWQN